MHRSLYHFHSLPKNCSHLSEEVQISSSPPPPPPSPVTIRYRSIFSHSLSLSAPCVTEPGPGVFRHQSQSKTSDEQTESVGNGLLDATRDHDYLWVRQTCSGPGCRPIPSKLAIISSHWTDMVFLPKSSVMDALILRLSLRVLVRPPSRMG
ncbi:uncharacterized protein LDX57_005777 [Aspergillus melleus]|uniref:uncharacterized protein n=1 Tax=Aspergillus melleus TaxID=138277 RepID=UPI001E8EF0C7|nr:uncharacterized protein LDX57_005777 [Aspergillus melleus]KAH8428072.1 hypothetical protein LDX57_005777 [Aspergillus melleus]